MAGEVRQLSADAVAGADDTATIAARDELERAFEKLSLEHRAVFVLHHYVGMPLVEVAALLEIPAGTARSRLHYATSHLRAALAAQPDSFARNGGIA